MHPIVQFIHDLEEVMVFLHHLDKFVKDEALNKTISNLVGGNMKIIEEYAQRKVDEKTEVIIRNLNEEGYGINDIARIARVSLDFVEKTLAK